jgi:hypothetical protein
VLATGASSGAVAHPVVKHRSEIAAGSDAAISVEIAPRRLGS